MEENEMGEGRKKIKWKPYIKILKKKKKRKRG